ncbi:Uncharacterised protein [Escherichia coli]|uniref:Uncharacterized protein n=1 Tax=Escherichia coli TaxID=562 RepID=A0A2X1N2M3_ECOLX|nr:Uncharacterised protein [Escherichia coli]
MSALFLAIPLTIFVLFVFTDLVMAALQQSFWSQ